MVVPKFRDLIIKDFFFLIEILNTYKANNYRLFFLHFRPKVIITMKCVY